MATNSSPSASIRGADDLCLCSVCHAMWLSGPYHEHTSTFHPGSASSTPEMAVRRLVVCCPSNLVLTRAQEAEVKRPHRITQYASLGDERSTDGMTVAYTILRYPKSSLMWLLSIPRISSRSYLMRMLSRSVYWHPRFLLAASVSS